MIKALPGTVAEYHILSNFENVLFHAEDHLVVFCGTNCSCSPPRHAIRLNRGNCNCYEAILSSETVRWPLLQPFLTAWRKLPRILQNCRVNVQVVQWSANTRAFQQYTAVADTTLLRARQIWSFLSHYIASCMFTRRWNWITRTEKG